MGWDIILYFALGAIFAFFLFGGWRRGKEGACCDSQKSLIIIQKDGTCLHIHHWIIFLVIGSFLVSMHKHVEAKNFPFFALSLGFCAGAVIQGLTYKDAFQIKCKEKCK
jgi:hypothetical protein